MKRRTFLATAAALAASPADGAAPRIIDTHTHFYDPARPQGVPWPPKSEKMLYRRVLPDEYRQMTKPLGIQGTIEVEASPWLEDNQWVLDLAASDSILVGTVGHLEAGKPDFGRHLSRFHKNRLFRGIRLGNLWGRSPGGEFSEARYISDLRLLAEAGLELDAIGGAPVLAGVVRITDQAPSLRVVIDHMPFDPPQEDAARAAYQRALGEIGKRPQVYAKVSNVLRRSGDRVPDEVSFYRQALDELWEIFGPDRLVFGSNWPVSDLVAPYATVLKVVREYFAAKGEEASEKYFWKNSKAAYRWVER